MPTACSGNTTTTSTMETNITGNVSSFRSPHWSKVYFYMRYAVFFLEAIVIIVANILTLIAVKRTKKLRQIPANTYLVSLAIADGMIGVLLPAILLTKLTYSQNVWILSACLFRGPYYAVFCVSLFTLLAVAFDRYLAVIHALAYRMRMTARIAGTLCACIWVIQVGLWESLTCYYGSRISVKDYSPGAAQDIFPRKMFFVLSQVEILLPIVGNTVIYVIIYFKLRMKKAVVSVAPRNNREESNQPSSKAKAFTRMMALVLGYLIFAWLPYYIMAPLYKVNDPNTPDWYLYAYDVVSFLFHSNSFMNPVIYSWQNRDFREAYAKILGCKLNRSTEAENTNSTTRARISTVI